MGHLSLKIEKKCLNCGNRYRDVPKRRIKFCSLKCFGLYSKKTYVCKNCGIAYLTTPTRNTKYCSRWCLTQFLIGKKRPAWIGEKITIAKLAGREPTGSRKIRKIAKFLKVRKFVLERDCFTCCICYESGIDIHHIKTIRDCPELAYDKNNLITLCKKCHDTKVSRHEKEWENYFYKILKRR